jgi:hypothetical protein
MGSHVTRELKTESTNESKNISFVNPGVKTTTTNKVKERQRNKKEMLKKEIRNEREKQQGLKKGTKRERKKNRTRKSQVKTHTLRKLLK